MHYFPVELGSSELFYIGYKVQGIIYHLEKGYTTRELCKECCDLLNK